MKRQSKWMAWLLAVCMVLVMNVPIVTFAQEIHTREITSGQEETAQEVEETEHSLEKYAQQAAAADVLVPVATQEDLKTAIENADSDTIILVITAISITETLEVDRDLRFFGIGSLTANNIPIFRVTESATLSCEFNEQQLRGGGIVVDAPDVTIQNFTIESCHATNAIRAAGNLTVDNCAITGNASSGIYMTQGSSLVVKDSMITSNHVSVGGGIYAEENVNISIENTGIVGNAAFDAGGGIFTESLELLRVDADSYFNGNNGSYFHIKEEHKAIHDELIKTKSFSEGNEYGYNGRDIDFPNSSGGSGGGSHHCTVTFDGNGGMIDGMPSITVSIISGTYALPPNEEVQDVIRTGYLFLGWSLDPLDYYPSYGAGEDYDLKSDTTFYAIWERAPEPEPDYLIFYDANGGDGISFMDMAKPGQSYTIKGAKELGMTKFRNICFGWNTDPNSNDVEYEAGDVITPTGNMTLYAVWLSPYFGSSAELQRVMNEPRFDTIYMYQDFTMTGPQSIYRDINIVLDGEGDWVMTAAPGRRHLEIWGENLAVSISGITFDGGNSHGGIYVHTGQLTLTDVTVRNCIAQIGGGLYLNHAATVIIGGNSLFENNTATNAEQGLQGWGGGIFARDGSELTLTEQVTMRNNSSQSYGGAVFLQHSSLYMEDKVQFVGNHSGIDGGAIQSTYSHTELSGNVVFKANSSGHLGGAYSSEYSTLVAKDNVLFEDNFASSFGGAVFVQLQGSTDIGGNATFKSNIAGRRGGALYVGDSDIHLQGSVNIIGNSAQYGGGIYIGDYSKSPQPTEPVPTNTSAIIEGNVVIQNNFASLQGGGIYMRYGKTLNILGDVCIQSNTATEHGGGLFAEAGTVTIKDSASILSNTAVNGNGGGICSYADIHLEDNSSIRNNSAGAIGGGMSVTENQNNLSGTAQISGNTAVYGGGVYLNSGAINLSDRASMSNNEASTSGGAILLFHTTMNTYGNVLFNGNKAYEGSAITLDGAKIYTYGNTTISNNTATEHGAVFGTNGSYIETREHTKISGNTVTHHGGGASVAHGSFAFFYDNTTFDGNQARAGGALFVSTNSHAEARDNTSLENNRAQGGGGVYLEYSSFFGMTDTAKIKNNHATSTDLAGGGIHAHTSCLIQLHHATEIIGNTTPGMGGGVYIYASTINMFQSSIITQNVASVHGGIYHLGSYVNMYDQSKNVGNSPNDRN